MRKYPFFQTFIKKLKKNNFLHSLSTNTCRSKRSKRCINISSETKQKKSFKNNISFFKTMRFISDFNLNIFLEPWLNLVLVEFFLNIFTYFPPALNEPKSPRPTFAFALKFRVKFKIVSYNLQGKLECFIERLCFFSVKLIFEMFIIGVK